ncbi:MAG: glycogen synthase GlgA [Candidatus Methylacidiphilales bacterium]|nr:glycogen synthase GlgA [Candidatus Methylacidiphilales bacterium]
MNILFAASELSPYAKTGGLGDVSAALPAALRARGHSISFVLPYYRGVRDHLEDITATDIRITVQMGKVQETARIHTAVTDRGVRLFLVEREEYFDRSNLYGTSTGDYADNAGRYIFFSKVIVELARYIRPIPQVLHLHDWQTGLVPALVRAARLPYRTVYTIHNLAFQGSFWAFDFDLTNLPGEYFSPPGVEFYGRLNLMKAGINLAHQVTTVSPRYAREIQTLEFGCGLDGVLRENAHKLSGILNGADYTQWNPATDTHLAQNFSTRSLAGKEACKKALLASFKLPATDGPVLGIVSRLANQKGFDLITSLMDELASEDVRIIILGSGDSFYEDYFREFARKHPGKCGIKIAFSETLAHEIVAGSDFLLMPSVFEPCGLTQLYALANGTPPIVHETGGLADSVENYNEHTGAGTGFKFAPYETNALRRAVRRALAVYQDKPALEALRLAGMSKRFSWDGAAAGYEKVYEKAMTE